MVASERKRKLWPRAFPGGGAGDFAAAPEPPRAALVDVAAIGVLQARMAREPEVLVEQLRSALTSRVVLEQAKGFVSERLDVDLAAAFVLIREYARRNHRLLTDVARAVVTRGLGAGDLLEMDAERS